MITRRIWTGRLLILFGALVLAWAGYATLSRSWTQRAYEEAIDAERNAPPAEAPAPKPVLPASMPMGEPIGTIKVPRLGLAAVVAEGDDKPVLDKLAGHLSDTPLPWNDGNSAVAAHRDGLFRPLKGIKVGDRIQFETAYGDFEYRVKETFIVDPDDVWVLNPTIEPSLTLISCYPFNFIGNAPRRFIVRAERVPVIESPGPVESTTGLSRDIPGSGAARVRRPAASTPRATRG
jgi:sortase A